jgi:PAS domain-containing protein
VAILEDTRRAREQDLIKRREAEETLRGRERSRYIIDSAADAIVSIDDEAGSGFSPRPSSSSASRLPRSPGNPSRA